MTTVTPSHIKAGDQMQSALSRIIAHLSDVGLGELPYEVMMAAFEGQSAITEWTDARRKDSV